MRSTPIAPAGRDNHHVAIVPMAFPVAGSAAPDRLARRIAVAAVERAERLEENTPEMLAELARGLAGRTGDAWTMVFEAKELLRRVVLADPGDIAGVVACGWVDSTLALLIDRTTQSTAGGEDHEAGELADAE